MIERPELVVQLEAELEETRKVRDQWCAEYTMLRDELKTKIDRLERLLEEVAIGLGVKI